MPKKIEALADELNRELRAQGKDVLTYSYPGFYSLADRDRLRDSFKDEFERALKGHALLVAWGQSIVAILKDYRFSPDERGK
jgi:hypothetical protein